MFNSFTAVAIRHLVPCNLLLITLAALQTICLAQAPNGKQYTSTMNDLNERANVEVDPSSLGLNISISLADFPGRGVSLPVTLRYSSKIWQIKHNGTNINPGDGNISEYTLSGVWYTGTRAGWTSSLTVPYIEFTGQTEPFIARFNLANRDLAAPDDGNAWDYAFPPRVEGNSTPLMYSANRAILRMPDGSSHEMRQDDLVHFGTVGGPVNRIYYAADGSRIKYDPTSQVVFLPDGSRYLLNTANGAQYIDRNGNTLNYNSNTSEWTDTLGRVIPDPLGGSSGSDYHWTVPTAQGGTATYIFRWRLLSESLTDTTQPLHYIGPVMMKFSGGYPFIESVPGPSLFGESSLGLGADRPAYVLALRFSPGPPELFNPGVLSEIELPNGQKYRFTYNVYAELDKIYLPTGGYKRYRYNRVPASDLDNQSLAYSQANRGVVEGIESVTGKPQDETPPWTFQPASLGTANVTATNPDGSFVRRYIHERDALNNMFNASPREAIAGRIYDEEFHSASGQMLRRILTNWVYTGPQHLPPIPHAQEPIGMDWTSRDARVTRKVEILLDTSGNALAKATEYLYDNDLNVASTKYYDYVSISKSTGQSAPIGSIPNGALLKTEETTYLVNDASIAQTTRDAYRARHLTALPSKTLVRDSSNAVVAATEYKYDESAFPLTTYSAVSGWSDPQTPFRGNVTTIRRWLDNNHPWGGWTSGTWIETHTWYDQCGNAIKVRDANNNDTIISYEDNFYDFPPQNSHAYPTSVTTAGPAHTTFTKHDFNSGLVREVTDPNNIKTRYDYNDSFNRLTRMVRAEGTIVENQTTIQYEDYSRIATTTSDRNSFDDNILKSQLVYDGFGRTIESRQYETGSSYIAINTIYDVLGSVSQVSNPRRSGDPLWTTTEYDALGRVIRVTTPDGAQVITQYSGNQVTVTDQAGKSRRSKTDALGRMTEVTENPGGLSYLTTYEYDTLNNLLKVKQGLQVRNFAYDSVSRLISATNPESGTITYAYDPNGNLLEKTDAREVKTTMTYDELNRMRTTTYSATTPEGELVANATPPVSYFYDDYSTLPGGGPTWPTWSCGGQTLPNNPVKGRVIGVTYGTGSDGTYYRYDAAGRIIGNLQRMGTPNFVTRYAYNLADAVLEECRGYSSATRAAVRNMSTYDDAGRLTDMRTSFNPHTTSKYLVEGISYTPFGALQTENYGNGLIHSIGYNNRLQPTEIRLGTPGNPESVFTIYNLYGTAANPNVQDSGITLAQNNGNLARTKYVISGALKYSQTFQYDPVNRLKYAVEHNNGTYTDAARAWYQTFEYDFAGNRGINRASTSDNVDGANSALQKAEFSEVNNRITHADYHYDVAGNLTGEPGKRYTYDAFNRLVTAEVVGGATSQYVYDGNGRRVKKTVSGVGTRFEYGAGGELIAERNDAGVVTTWYYYRNGELLATSENGTMHKYAASDHLGSPRAWTDEVGSLTEGGRHDYLPFGEELGIGVGIRSASIGYGGDSVRQKFTGYEHDDETGLEFAQARYYASVQGRFTSTDEFKGGPDELWVLGSGDPEKQALVYANINIPQSLNKYQYCFNNPLRYVDPDGQNPQDGGRGRAEERDVMALAAGKISPEEFKKRQQERVYYEGVGAVIGIGIVVAPNATMASLAWMLRNPATVLRSADTAAQLLEGNPASLRMGTLTIAARTGLNAAEVSTGARLAKQIGGRLVESAHVGADFVDAVTKKTFDAMGTPDAYKYFGSGKKFFESIVHHVNKSVDHVAIDLMGASKVQIKAIKGFVSGLTKEQQGKIIYIE